MKKISASELAKAFQAYKNCIASKNTFWDDKWKSQIEEMVDLLPSGSGIDTGCQFDWDKSTGEKLVFNLSFHHMDDGFYNGWTQHTITITPSFVFGYSMKISGKDRNGIKDYLSDVFGSLFTL